MKIAEVVELVLGGDIDVEFVAYDGSKTGRMGSDIRVDIRSPRAMAAMLASPGQLGVARAYVDGDIEIEGDIFTALERFGAADIRSASAADKVRVFKEFAPLMLKRPPVPPEEIKLSGRRHGKRRDAEAISHHYDVSNVFYRMLLGPSMAYTCAVFPDQDASLEEAQQEKFDLVCRKLDLQPGMRLLDVGCGWGGMVHHATENYGVRAIGVTLSQPQAEWGQRVLEEQGLAAHSEIRFGDYRDVQEAGFPQEMGELVAIVVGLARRNDHDHGRAEDDGRLHTALDRVHGFLALGGLLRIECGPERVSDDGHAVSVGHGTQVLRVAVV